jgi:hypothetical protein
MQFKGWPRVYKNLLSVKTTLDWLHSGRSITVPDECRSLVEPATHHSLWSPTRLGKRARQAIVGDSSASTG